MSKLLLDTQVWIWAYEGDRALGRKSRRLLQKLETKRYVAPISTLEIARLVLRGQIVLSCPLLEWVERSSRDLCLETLSFEHETAMESYQLPGSFHPDPADRQLVTTARIMGCALMTADERILSCPQVTSMDAGK